MRKDAHRPVVPLFVAASILATVLLSVACAIQRLPAPPPPPPPPPPAAAPAPPAVEIRASRLFAGPGQYPPGDFAAYGIVAFRSAATSQSEARYLAICEGYLAGLPQAAALEFHGVPLDEQMATVWPLTVAALAGDLNRIGGDSRARCPQIVSAIDTVTSRDAFRNAARAGSEADFAGDGPYLIAWSPATAFGQPDVVVLAWDLSGVTTAAQATRMFSDWAVEIERDPSLWRSGWDRERLRTVLRLWADRWGTSILRALGVDG